MVDSGAELPLWVRKRDGSVQPFNADKISAALHAASETLGKGDAFLSRELTQGVIFFLGQEQVGDTAHAADIAELTAKVVRELGHPKLAKAFADEHAKRAAEVAITRPARTFDVRLDISTAPEVVVETCLREYSLSAIFRRDLAAAHRDGLLTLLGLEAPRKLFAQVCDLGTIASSCATVAELSRSCWQAVVQCARQACNLLALEGLEFALARLHADAASSASVLGEIRAAANDAGILVILHLNCASPPAWANGAAGSPLFADTSSASGDVQTMLARFPTILDNDLRQDRLHLDWHIQQQQIDGNASTLAAIATLAAGNANIRLTFDRPRKPISLGDGLDRTCPAILQAVTLNLPLLLQQKPVNQTPDAFLEKLATLAQMAVSAGVQKRRYLREQCPALAHGFLLDRARLVAIPVGLHEVVQHLTSDGLQRVDLGRRIITTLTLHLRKLGAAVNLDVAIDASQIAPLAGESELADLREQIRNASTLYAGSGGPVVLHTSRAPVPDENGILQLIRYAWTRSEITRLSFARS